MPTRRYSVLRSGVWETSRNAALAEARTANANVVIFVQLFYLFNHRSLMRSSQSLGAFSNRWLIAGATAMITAQMAFTCLPLMNEGFHSAPLDATAWLRVLGVALSASLIVGFEKWVRSHAEPNYPVGRKNGSLIQPG